TCALPISHGRKKDDVRARQRKAARRLGHDQVIADKHTGRTQVRRGKNRERTSTLPRAGFGPCRTNFVITANLLAIATEQEGSVVRSAIALAEIAANDEIH